MITRPANTASEADILDYARVWVKLASSQGFEAAIAELDPRPDVAWSQSLFEELTFDHFGDARQPKITDPEAVSNLRIHACRYSDGSGFAVDHDLPLDGKRSDFTAQFDFRKGQNSYTVYLHDIHVL